MSLNLLYSFKEGLGGFKRAKLSSFLSILTIFISLTLLGIFLILTSNGIRIVHSIRARIDLEVFLDNSLDIKDIYNLKKKIEQLEGVKGIEFISKDKAAEEFKAEFGGDLLNVLGGNPLPSSFRIRLKKGYRSSKEIGVLSAAINKMTGIDEVVFRSEFLRTLEKYINIMVVIDLVLGLIVSLGAIVLVSNAIRLTILAKEETIEIMKLMGATNGFVRRPFVIEGIAQGIMGGLCSAAFLLIIVRVTQFFVPNLIFLEKGILLVLVVLGGLFGLIGSLFSLRRYLA